MLFAGFFILTKTLENKIEEKKRKKVSLPYYDLCRSESISLQTLYRYDRNVVAYLLRYVRYGGGFVCVSYNRLKPAAHRRPHAFAYVNKQQTANAV